MTIEVEKIRLTAQLTTLKRKYDGLRRRYQTLGASRGNKAEEIERLTQDNFDLEDQMYEMQNKIVNLENQSKYMDSTALEIFNKLVLVENKIVTLTNSYNEMAKLKSGEPISSEPKFNSAEYKKTYMESLGHLQNQNLLQRHSKFQR